MNVFCSPYFCSYGCAAFKNAKVSRFLLRPCQTTTRTWHRVSDLFCLHFALHFAVKLWTLFLKALYEIRVSCVLFINVLTNVTCSFCWPWENLFNILQKLYFQRKQSKTPGEQKQTEHASINTWHNSQRKKTF